MASRLGKTLGLAKAHRSADARRAKSHRGVVRRFTSSRSARAVAAVLAVGLASLGAPGLTTAASAAARVTPATNPDLASSCGLDVVLVLDESYSIHQYDAEDSVRTAARTFLDSFKDTNTRVGVAKFRTTGTKVLGLTNVTTASVANGGTHDNAIDAYDPPNSSSGSGIYTNWQDGLLKGKDIFDTASPSRSVPKLLVFVTDGAPNRTNGPGGAGTVQWDNEDAEAGAVDPAVTVMNQIKGSGVHALVVAAGQALNGSNAAYNDALARVSEHPSPKTYPATSFNAATTDLIKQANFSALAADLRMVANAVCDGSLTIKKKISSQNAPTTYTDAGAGWEFETTVDPAGGWVTPNAGSGAARTASTEATGTALFQWNPGTAGWTKNATVKETAKADFTLDHVTCSTNGGAQVPMTLTAGKFTAAVGAGKQVACTVYNKFTGPGSTDVAVTKSVSSATAVVGSQVTWTVTARNNGPKTTANNVVITDTLPAGNGLTMVNGSSSTNAGSYNEGTGVWSIPSLAKDVTRTLTFKTVVAKTGAQKNNADLTSLTENDTNASNNHDDATVTGIKANVRITKTADVDSQVVGGNVVWTVKVTNDGAADAQSVVVTDVLPAGLQYVSNTRTKGSYDTSSHVWTVGSLNANGGSATLTLTTKGTTLGIKKNVADVTTTTPETDTSDNHAEDTVKITAPDLEVTKTASAESVGFGDTVTWTVTVKNTGDADAAGVKVQDVLPAGATLVSTNPAGAFTGSTWNVGTLAKSGGTKTVTITTTLSTVGAVKNTACATTTTVELDTQDNCGDDTVTVVATDVTISKIADVSEVFINGTVTWTVQITNNSGADAKNVVVVDTVPAGLIVDNVQTSQGTYALGTNVWSAGTLAKNGGAATLTMITRVPGVEGSLTNNADVTTTTPETDVTNNHAQDDVKVVAADVEVTKTADVDQAVVGSNVTWTVVAKNTGSAVATGVVVSDVLPAGLELVSTVPAGALVDGEWAVGTLAANGGTKTLTVVTKAVATGTQVNEACIDTTTPQVDRHDNCDDDSVLITSTDVTITKVGDVEGVLIGGQVVWTVKVVNNGTADAANVVVTESLPASFSVTSTSVTQGTYDALNDAWAVGTLPANGGSATLTLKAKAGKVAGMHTNAVDVTTTTPETDTTNNHAEDSVSVVKADLQVTKDADAETVVIGDTVTWTIVATNIGEADAQDVVVTDVLPAGLQLVSTDPANALVDNEWAVGSLAANGGSKTLTLVTKVTKTGTITNEACGTMSTPEIYTHNNCDDDTVGSTIADVSVVKTAGSDTSVLGDTVTWTIVATNNGDADAKDVVVTDVLPAGLELVSTDPAGALVDGAWAVGTLAKNGGSKTLTVVTTSTATGSVTNEACAVTSTPESEDGNNCGEDDHLVTAPDLTVVKTVSDATVGYGDEVVWDVVVTNTGDAAAQDVVVTDVLPAGLQLVSTDPANALVDNEWAVGSLAANGGTATLKIRTKVVAAGDTVNTACASTSTPEPDQADNCDDETVNAVKTDVAITKTADAEEVLPGADVVWTVVVTNDSDADATAVEVADTLPAGLTFVSANAGQGTYDPATNVWSVGTLVKGGSSATLTLTTQAPSTPGELVNKVDVTTETPETDLTNNHAEDDVVVRTPDLVVTKTASADSAYVGGSVSWTITVLNQGDAAAQDVVVTDLVPAGLHVTSSDAPSQGSFDLGLHTWAVGALEPGASATLTLHSEVLEAGEHTNVACATTTTPESDTENNCGEDTTTGEEALPLEISKINDPGGQVEVGDTLSYTLHVSVPDAATLPHDAVMVSDYVPGHDPARPASGSTTYVSGSAACEGDLLVPGGTCDVALTTDGDGEVTQVTWALGRMAPGQELDVTFDVTVDGQEDATTESVDILNAGSVFSAYAPVVESNEVVNTVDLVEVQDVKIPGPADQVDPPAGDPRLAFTGIELVRQLGLGLLLLLAGAAAMRMTRRKQQQV